MPFSRRPLATVPILRLGAEDSRDRATSLPNQTRKPLEAIFTPNTVAVIGASEETGSAGQSVLRNLATQAFNDFTSFAAFADDDCRDDVTVSPVIDISFAGSRLIVASNWACARHRVKCGPAASTTIRL